MIPVTRCIYRNGRPWLDWLSYGGEPSIEDCDRIVENNERWERRYEDLFEVAAQLGREHWLGVGALLELEARLDPEAQLEFSYWLETEARLADGESRRSEFEWRFQVVTPTLRFWMAPILRDAARTIHIWELIYRLEKARRIASLILLRGLVSLFLRLFVLLRRAPRSSPDADDDFPEPLRHILAPDGQTDLFTPLN